MSVKDKLEIGLKPDAAYRPDNLPEFQQDDPNCIEGATPGDSPAQQNARHKCDVPSEKTMAKPKTARG